MDRNRMKNMILMVLTAAVLTVWTPADSYAQEYISTPVSISKEKVRVGGKVCYSHIVLERQTLFSIAKAYNVTIDEIYEFNPTLKETGLKKNSIILIPSKEAEAAPVVEQPVVKESTPAPAEVKEVKEVKKKKMKVHTVKWYEDIDVIAEKYGVTAEAIIKANNLSDRKLAKRQKLNIPEPGEYPEDDITVEEEAADETAGTDETEEAQETDETQNIEPDWMFIPKKDVKVTLILPLNTTTGNVSRNNMDFYSGVLLAVKDLADTGVSTELNVYDSSDSSHPIVSEDIEGSDIVIGPISSGDLGRMLEADAKPGMMISPLDQRAEKFAYTNSNFIQAPTPLTVQYQDLLNWMKEDVIPGDKVVMITEKGARPTESVTQLIQAADSSGLNFIPFSYSILEGRDITEPLTNLMTAEGTNRVLIASDSEAFVNDVVRNLNILVYNKLDVVLYAPSRIRNFETIEVENLHNTSLHTSLGYLIDYDSQQVKNFLLKYRALYNTEPTQYAFQGYDIASYFIGMCSRYGNNWTKRLDDTETQMLQSIFRFPPIEDGGYVNNGVRRLVYGSGWSVTKTR
jgi:ABC-type branched-subunit amino acid transport system substrate-binding protein